MEREQTTIRIPEKLKKHLQNYADEKGIGLNATIISFLNEEKNHQEKLSRD